MNKSIVLTLVVLIFAVGIVLFFFGRDVDNYGGETVDNVSDLRVGENAIYVPDQKPDSDVLVGLVVLSEGGFVVIHEDVNASPGAVIGSSEYLSAGESRNVSVSLTRQTANGDMLVAMLHRDTGNASFNAADDPPVSENGSTIMMNFQVSANVQEPGEVVF